MKARHVTGIICGFLLALIALIAPSVPIPSDGPSASLTQADAICRSGLGEFARYVSGQAQYQCSTVGHLMALAHLLLVTGLVLAGLCVWRGVLFRTSAS